MKKVTLVVLLALAMVPMASADDIDFLFGSGIGSWAWPGGVGSQLVAADYTVTVNGFPAAFDITIFSGPAIGGAGTLLNPFTWGAGGSIVVGDNLCGGNDCFSGTFTNLQAAFLGGGNAMSFFGNFVSGYVDPILLAALGISDPTTLFTGLLHMDVNPAPASFEAGGRGSIGSGDLYINQVPEPGTLALFGSGLIGIAGMLRRKLSL